jgi:hypothetical protein
MVNLTGCPSGYDTGDNGFILTYFAEVLFSDELLHIVPLFRNRKKGMIRSTPSLLSRELVERLV